jgi:hypothetical protein
LSVGLVLTADRFLSSRKKPAPSVPGGFLDVFDDPDLDGGLLGFEFEAELLVEGGEDRWAGRVDGLAVK